jgi:alpha/beta hydrolase family protein
MSQHATQTRADALIVLIPSPLLGPYSWSLVAQELRARGWEALVSEDLRDPLDRQPCWRRTVGGVESSLRDVPDERSIALVAHSGAGPLLPAVATAVRQPIAAYLFVDAGLPTFGSSRLQAIDADEPRFAAELRAALDAGQRFPAWTDEGLSQLVPDPDRRRRLLKELRPRGPEYWTEELPTVTRWPNAPCGYLQFSAPYRSAADRARRAGWPTRHLPAGHFHQLVDPAGVVGALIDLLGEQGISSAVRRATSVQKGATT